MAQEVLDLISSETEIQVTNRSKDDLLTDILTNWDTLSSHLKDKIVDSLLDNSVTEETLCFA